MLQEEKTRCKAFQLLLNKGAHVNLQDGSGRTALSYACQMRCNDIVRILVQNNVDPDIADDKGLSPCNAADLIVNFTKKILIIVAHAYAVVHVRRGSTTLQTALHSASGRNGTGLPIVVTGSRLDGPLLSTRDS